MLMMYIFWGRICIEVCFFNTYSIEKAQNNLEKNVLNLKCSEMLLAVIFKVTRLTELSQGQKLRGKLETQILGGTAEHLP